LVAWAKINSNTKNNGNTKPKTFPEGKIKTQKTFERIRVP